MRDGRLKIGDKLLSVNQVSVVNHSLQFAVQQLVAVPLGGMVTIGICHPLPMSPDISSDPSSPLTESDHGSMMFDDDLEEEDVGEEEGEGEEEELLEEGEEEERSVENVRASLLIVVSMYIICNVYTKRNINRIIPTPPPPPPPPPQKKVQKSCFRNYNFRQLHYVFDTIFVTLRININFDKFCLFVLHAGCQC